MTQIFSAIPRGFMRFDISNIISIIARTAEISLSIFLLYHSFGIKALLWASTASTLILGIANIVVSARLMKKRLLLHPRGFDWKILKKMYGFGANLQMANLAMWIVQNFDKLILGWIINASATALYDIGAKIVSLLRQVSWVLFAVIIPKASEIHVRRDYAKLYDLYIKGTRFVIVLGLGSVGVLFPFASLLLSLWLGKSPDVGSVAVFQILLVGIMMSVTAGIGSSIIKGMGKPVFETISTSIMACCNVVLSLLLCKTNGLMGVAWGTSIAAVVGAAILSCFVNKEFGIRNSGFFTNQYGLPLLFNAALVFGGVALTNSSQFAGLQLSIKTLVAACFILLAVCASVVYYLKTAYLTMSDVKRIWAK